MVVVHSSVGSTFFAMRRTTSTIAKMAVNPNATSIKLKALIDRKKNTASSKISMVDDLSAYLNSASPEAFQCSC